MINNFWSRLFCTSAMVIGTTGLCFAQPPQGGEGRRGEGREGGGFGGMRGGNTDEQLARLMAMDKNGDGTLTADELAGSRLKNLIERADADKNGVVTKEELAAMIQREQGMRGGAPGGFGPGGPGAGGFGGGGMGGPGGPGGFGPRGMMKPGTILPDFMIEQLQMTAEQRNALAVLQSTVDAELAKILTSQQKEALMQMSQGPRGGGPGAGGPGGFGGGFGPGGEQGFGGNGQGQPGGAGPGRGQNRGGRERPTN